MHATLLLTSLVLSPAVAAAPATTGEGPVWSGFRGNNGCGVAPAGHVPPSLDPDNLAWKVDVPRGYSSPVVTDELVVLTAAEGTSLITLALDRVTGETRWEQEVPFDGKRVGANSSAAPTPVTDGERIYCLFHATGLVAYDMEGEEVWSVELGPFEIPHGMSSSPVLHGDLLVVQADQDAGSFLAAFDRRTGEERWRVEREGVVHSYATPAIYAPEKGPAQVVVSGSFQIAAYSLEDGKKLWWVNGSAWQTKAVPIIDGDVCYVSAYMVPTSELGLPTVTATFEETLAERDADGNGKIGRAEWNDNEGLNQAWFIFDLDNDEELDERDFDYLVESGRATGGLFAIRMDGEGDVTETHVSWLNDDRRNLPDAVTPVLLNGILYLVKEPGILVAIDAGTGEVLKRERVAADQFYASPVAAGDRIVTASLGGQLSVVRAGSDWEVLSTHDLGEQTWSTPAIAGEQVFVRTQSALYCFVDMSGE